MTSTGMLHRQRLPPGDPHLLEPLEAKAVLLGNSGVGKTSLLARCRTELAGGRLGDGAPEVSTTLGPVFSSLLLRPEEPARVEDGGGSGCARLQVWDTAGAERFRSLAPLYYRGASAALLVFDMASQASYAELDFWVRELGRHQRTLEGQRLQTRLFLVGNKCDLPAVQVLRHQAKHFAASIGAEFHATSAVTGEGVLALFNAVAAALLLADGDQAAASSGAVGADARRPSFAAQVAPVVTLTTAPPRDAFRRRPSGLAAEGARTGCSC